LGLEAEQHDALHELLLEVRIAELRRHHLAGRHRSVRRDREPQHELALERRVLPERTVVERIDRALVLVEYPLDLLAAARRTIVARAGARPRSGCRRRHALDGALDARRRTPREPASARVAAERRGIDAAAARARARRDQ